MNTRSPASSPCATANGVAGDDFALLRAQEHQVAAVIGKVASIRRYITGVDLAVTLGLGLKLRRQGKAQGAILALFGKVVKDDRSRRASLSYCARAVGRLTVGEHATALRLCAKPYARRSIVSISLRTAMPLTLLLVS